MINKDKLLERLKDLILTLRDKHSEFSTNEKLFKKWREQNKKLHEDLKSLNSCDLDYISSQFAPWFKKEILPHIQSHQKELREYSNWI